jgi:hypothetical protein
MHVRDDDQGRRLAMPTSGTLALPTPSLPPEPQLPPLTHVGPVRSGTLREYTPIR